jgi:selenide, water dikinase
LTKASGLAAVIDTKAVPKINGVIDLIESGELVIPGGTRRNRDWVEPVTTWDPSVAESYRWLLCDAMTSGGLLVATPAGARGPGVRIGRLTDGVSGALTVSW